MQLSAFQLISLLATFCFLSTHGLQQTTYNEQPTILAGASLTIINNVAGDIIVRTADIAGVNVTVVLDGDESELDTIDVQFISSPTSVSLQVSVQNKESASTAISASMLLVFAILAIVNPKGRYLPFLAAMLVFFQLGHSQTPMTSTITVVVPESLSHQLGTVQLLPINGNIDACLIGIGDNCNSSTTPTATFPSSTTSTSIAPSTTSATSTTSTSSCTATAPVWQLPPHQPQQPIITNTVMVSTLAEFNAANVNGNRIIITAPIGGISLTGSDKWISATGNGEILGIVYISRTAQRIKLSDITCHEINFNLLVNFYPEYDSSNRDALMAQIHSMDDMYNGGTIDVETYRAGITSATDEIEISRDITIQNVIAINPDPAENGMVGASGLRIRMQNVTSRGSKYGLFAHGPVLEGTWIDSNFWGDTGEEACYRVYDFRFNHFEGCEFHQEHPPEGAGVLGKHTLRFYTSDFINMEYCATFGGRYLFGAPDCTLDGCPDVSHSREVTLHHNWFNAWGPAQPFVIENLKNWYLQCNDIYGEWTSPYNNPPPSSENFVVGGNTFNGEPYD